MSASSETHFIHEMRGEGAPPRSNGELLFAEPWEGRAFGMAVALSEQGRYPWEEFRQRLIQTIGRWEREHLPGPADGHTDDHDHENEHDPTGCGHSEWNYYDQWLAAFEGLLLDKGVVFREELDRRTEEFMTTRRDEAF